VKQFLSSKNVFSFFLMLFFHSAAWICCILLVMHYFGIWEHFRDITDLLLITLFNFPVAKKNL
jgi:hypothetical protein